MQYAPYDGWTKRETPIELFYPRNANGIRLDSAGVDIYGAWNQIVASTSNDFTPFGVYVNLRITTLISTAVTLIWDMQIGIGAAGSEIVIAHFSDTNITTIVTPGIGSQGLASYGRFFPMGPTVIPSGTRIAGHVRANQTSSAYGIRATVYLAGYDNDSVPPMYPAYSYRAHLSGIHKAISMVQPVQIFTVTPGTGLGTYGSWVQAIAAAPSDLLITGISRGQPGAISTQHCYIELGTGASPNEVIRGRVASPGDLAANGNLAPFRTPIFVPQGERVAIRATANASTALSCKLLYEQLSGTTTSTSTTSTSSSTSSSTSTTVT